MTNRYKAPGVVVGLPVYFGYLRHGAGISIALGYVTSWGCRYLEVE